MNKHDYNNESIKSLTDREAVRLRPATYVGSNNIKGCFHLFVEILANSLDEFKAGYGKEININIYKDNSIQVIDKGRGLPVDWNKNENTYNYILLCEKLNAGGKYGQGNYKFSLGLNGLGLAITQLSSEYMDVEVFRDNYKYNLEFKKGENVNGLRKTKFDYMTTGTNILWKPDLEVFTEIDIPSDMIKDFIKKQSIVNKGVKILYYNEKDNETLEYYYENGIVDYIKELNSNNEQITDHQYWVTETKGRDREDKDEYDLRIELIFNFNKIFKLKEYYHNSSFLEHGGSPDEAIKSSFLYSIDKYLKDSGLYQKTDKKIIFDDIEDNLILVSNTYSTETSYENQTKKAITNKFIKEFMNEYIKEKLHIYFTENKLEVDKVMQQVLINMRSRVKAENTRLDVKKKLQGNITSLSNKIENLEDCNMKLTELNDRELWLVEGLSAASTVIDARDSKTMGVYALRGRFISSLKNSIEDVLNNKPALGLIGALNCGIEIPKAELKKVKEISVFEIEKLRYGKIIIATDSDSFGHGIGLSLITFFYKFMPTLLKQNRIYIALSPRYEITTNDKTYFCYNEDEKNQVVSGLGNKKYNIGIVKGLGELNKEVFWDKVMNPQNRKLKQLIYNNVMDDEIEYYFNALMGEDIESRKRFVRENIVNINIDEID